MEKTETKSIGEAGKKLAKDGATKSKDWFGKLSWKGKALTGLAGYELATNPTDTIAAAGGLFKGITGVADGLVSAGADMVHDGTEAIGQATGGEGRDLSGLIKLVSIGAGGYAMTKGHPLMGGVIAGMGLVSTMKDFQAEGGLMAGLSKTIQGVTGTSAETETTKAVDLSSSIESSASNSRAEQADALVGRTVKPSVEDMLAKSMGSQLSC